MPATARIIEPQANADESAANELAKASQLGSLEGEGAAIGEAWQLLVAASTIFVQAPHAVAGICSVVGTQTPVRGFLL